MPQTTAITLRGERLRRGWTLRELAAKCGDAGAPVDYSQLSKIERGIFTPRPKLRATLADLLGLDVERDFEAERRAS